VKSPRFLVAIALLVVIIAAFSGRWLVVDDPRKSDVIVVLAGEPGVRPARALELLRQGYAARMVLDVPAAAVIYDRTQLQIAQDYIVRLPERGAVSTCLIPGLSTAAESGNVGRCLASTPAKTVLLVTSDYHTRRALTIFTHCLPQYQFSIAAAYDPAQFGSEWWRHRQWAKINFDEWTKIAWWTVVDRWRCSQNGTPAG
jgi:hypothetical protein